MAITNKLKKLVHKKQWEMMDTIPTPTVAGAFYIKDPLGVRKTALAVFSATVQYLYNVEEDAHVQIPSLALAGTFGAGACGAWGRWSNTLTATGGTTNNVQLTTTISGLCVGRKIRFLTGANAGLERDISDVRINPVSGQTNVIYFDEAFPNAVSSGDTFAVSTGRYWIMNAGTIAAGIFKSYDPLTGVVTSLATANLPTTWGTDGRLVTTPSYFTDYSVGTATGGGASTLSTGKARTLNQFANYQIRITGGTGIGQVRTIASNTADGIVTVSSAWTTQPDVTSTYTIEANDDFLYLLGNNAVTMYRYQISTNTWTVVAPTVARTGAFLGGAGANFVGKTDNAKWADESNILDGRYIYCFRAGATPTIDRYDIALNKWESDISYINKGLVTFTTGSSYDCDGSRIYARKDATNMFFYYDVCCNTLFGFAKNMTADGAALIGDKLFTCSYIDPVTGEKLTWLYTVGNTSTLLYRMLVI